LKLSFTRHSKLIYNLQVQAEYFFVVRLPVGGNLHGRKFWDADQIEGREQPVHLRQTAQFHLLRGPICFSRAKVFSTNQRSLKLIA
jgi:hypothetical protein